jgi:uncharacterized RDD family membrane protein YckC
MTTPTPTPAYVGFWARFFATIVDVIILLVIILPPLLFIYGWAYLDPAASGAVAGPADIFFSWILPIFLTIGLWNWKQATPGKMLLSAKIVDATTGAKPTLKQWVVRYVGYLVSLLPLGLGYLWVAFDPRKQGWHDKMAGTVVIAGEKTTK